MAQYVVGLDDSLKRILVWKTTSDPTTLTNWSAQDKALSCGGVIKSLWAVQDGTDIHIATAHSHNGIPNNENGKIEYHVFSTSTDTWTTTRDDVISQGTINPADNEYACSIGVRSDGDVVIMYSSNGESTTSVRYRWKTATGSWGPVNGELIDDNSSDVHTAGVAVMGASDRLHFFYYDNTNDIVHHRSLSSGDVLDTQANVDATVSTAALHPIGRGISYPDNGNTVVKVPYYDVGEIVAGARFNSQANPTISTDSPVSDNDVEIENVSMIACYAVDVTDTWLLYSGGATSGTDKDIYSDTQEDGGSWGTDTEEQDAVTANRISVGVYDRGGTKLGYVWLDGTTTSYDEKDIAAAAVGLPSFRSTARGVMRGTARGVG
jgi:hypothetical protein